MIHIFYTILLVIPIFDPDHERRLIISWVCFVISFGFEFLELLSIYHDGREHYGDMYNVVDSLQFLFQAAYTIIVTVYKDVDLPFLRNNPEQEDYDIKTKGL